MPLPRPRFKMRRLMLAVALVALAFTWPAMEVRRERMREFARYHREKGGGPFCVSNMTPELRAYLDELARAAIKLSPERLDWHRDLWQKYAWAARYPFLPLSPDPPEPE